MSSSGSDVAASGTLLVLTTSGSADEAQRLADGLVEARVAACVNRIDGVQSTYRWAGRIEHDAESLLLIKTTEARYPELEAAIRRISGYELPEIVAVRLHGGLAGYLGWVSDAVQPA